MPVSIPSPDVVVAACFRPLPVRVRPRLPSLSPPALVPCPSASPRLPSASSPALVPCPSGSLAWCCHRRLLSSLARQRPLACRRRCRLLSSLARRGPPSPAVVVAACSRPLPVSIRSRLPSSSPPPPPPLPSPSRHRPRHPVNLCRPAPPQSLSPPSRLRRRRRQSRAFRAKYLFTYRGIGYQ